MFDLFVGNHELYGIYLVGMEGIEPSDAFSFKAKRAATTLHPN